MAVINGNDGDDTLTGNGGADTLNGFGGADWLAGRGGNDVLDGGSGSDWADYRSAGAAVRVSLAIEGAQNTGGAGTDTLIDIENLAGSRFADRLTGSDQLRFESFRGGAGNDTINGGAITERNNWTNSNQADYTGATSGATVDLGAGTASDGRGGTDTLININFVVGGAFADTLSGSDTNGRLEQFMGMAGADRIDGGDLAGGTNRIAYNLSPGAISVDLAAGTAEDGHGSIDTFENINAVRASAFDDTLLGSNRATVREFFEGRAGDDLINGRGGADVARYDNASAAVNVDLAAGLATGGDGNDTLQSIEFARGSNFDDTLTGTAGANGLEGRNGDDALNGGDGADTLNGAGGDDTLSGGAGVDVVDYTASTGALTVDLAAGTGGSTSEGADTLSSIEGVLGGLAADGLNGSGAGNAMSGNGGGDTLGGRAGNDTLSGGAGGDTLTGGIGDDRLSGDGGADRLAGGAGADRLDGGAGADTLTGGTGRDVYLVGSASDRVIETGTAAGEIDTVNATVDWQLGAGVERLTLSGNAAIDGGGNALANRIQGNLAANLLSGASGNDTVLGGAGNDTLTGGAGSDTLTGGGGDDTLSGGAGGDRLSGGLGADTFRFDAAPGAANADRVVGFVAADDRLVLDDADFAGIGAVGALAAGAFVAGTAAADANDRIVYDAATGRLWFDADGSGAVAAQLVASFGIGTVVSAADVFIG